MLPSTKSQLTGDINASLENGLYHIQLNRPSKKNALTMEMFATCASLLVQADADGAVQAILISGNGDAFTAGHDLQAFAQWPQSSDDPVPLFLHALAQLSKPLVMAVHGSAIGIGVTMLLHGDWVCCTPDATMRLPFADIGIGPEAASSLLLPQTIGLMRAKRLLYTGERFSGAQAYEWGLVSELSNQEDLLTTATSRARMLADKPTHSINQIKTWLRPAGTALESRIDDEINFINQSVLRTRNPEPHA